MFQVYGKIYAIGTKTDSIKVTIIPELQDVGWNRIDIIDENPIPIDSSVFKYCVFEYGFANNFNEKNNGGALSIYDTKVFISNCTFRYNKAIFSGGAIYSIDSDVTIDSCSFLNNMAVDTYPSGAIHSQSSKFQLTNSLFAGNSSIIGNNTLSVYGGDAIVDNCIFVNNYGGSSTITIADSYETVYQLGFTNNIIANNIAGLTGGVWFLGNDDFYSFPVIQNNLIVNNIATDPDARAGGAIILYCDPVFTNNTFAYNSSANGGGGIWVGEMTSPNIYNSIIYGNTLNGLPNQIYLATDDADPNFSNCCIEDGLNGITTEPGYTYSGNYINNISTNPMFIDTSMLNYLPACNSDCINGGTIDTTGLNLPIYDIRKLQRISGDTIDIGAYEFQALTILEQSTDTAACVGNDLLLFCYAIGDDITYQWQKDNSNIEGANESEFIITNSSLSDQGVYKCIVSNGCKVEQSEEILLNIFDLPSADLGVDTTLCFGESIILSPGSFDTYEWQNGSTDSTFIVNSQGVYWVEVSNGYCSSIDSIYVSYYDKLEVGLIDDTLICLNESIVLEPSSLFVAYEWSSGSELSYFNFIGSEFGVGDHIISLIATDINGCSEYDSTIIAVKPLPLIELPNDTIIGLTDTLILDAGDNFETYLWQDGENDQLYTILGQGYEPGLYQFYVEVMDVNGCTNADTIIVTIIDDSGIDELLTTNHFNIIPNPSQGAFTLSFHESINESFEIKIYSSEKRLVYYERFELFEPVLELKLELGKNPVPGIYLINISNNSFSEISKVIIK